MSRIFSSEETGVGLGRTETSGEIEYTAWVKMELLYRGNVAEMIQIGGGKLTKAGGDPGEPRKPRANEGSLSEPLTQPSDPLSDPLTQPLSK